MTLTLLLDLDDTLLDSKMDDFIPVYFHALGKAMETYLPPDELLKYLMQGTNAMIANDSPAQTLEEAFSAHFYPRFDVGRDVLDPELAAFYEEVFPTLSYLTKPRPEAVTLVEWAFSKGYRVAISTNPLFPRLAIEHRLRWAALAPEDYPFELVSSFEHFHYCKPNPAYWAEVLARMGWEENPVLVVGDDPIRDLRAAQGAGLPTYWVADEEAALPEDVNPPMGRGDIGALPGWIESKSEEYFLPDYQTQTAIVAIAKSTPAALKVILADLPEDAWRESPYPGEWSLVEVVSHLRDVEREVNLPRLKTFLQEENPFISADDTDLWVSARNYAAQDGGKALEDYVAARIETLQVLTVLADDAWQRAGRHAIFGPITLQEQLGFMTEHDRVHVRQIYETIQAV